MHHVILQAALEIGRRHLATALDRGQPLDSPERMATYFTAKLRHRTREIFAVLFLDTRHRVISYEELFAGTTDGTPVHAREVARRALHHNSVALVIAHNHPSGIATPSVADRNLTDELVAAVGILGIQILDHVIVGEGEVVSFVELGLL